MTDPLSELTLSKLTWAELPLMHVVWDRGPSTARQVHDALDDGRAYTTVATLLRILVDKGFLSATRTGRADVFAATLSRRDYQSRDVQDVVDRVFRGDPVSLVRTLVAAEPLGDAERAALRALVEDLPEDP
ncbi:MAG: BlaI/MecI/CopY family transcriptional regulator [Alphaproteobacteria bacterium]|nr:BlaI/MecI/CopY family transcriptional regulator [Alphaproteobacteria bacterium]